MQEVENKGHYIGQILAILGLQFIMLLFRLVEPLHWPIVFPRQYIYALNEFAYFGIELILVIVIVSHFIFKVSFKEMGLTAFKESIVGWIINVTFLTMSIGVAYLVSQLSKNTEIHIGEIAGRVMINFIAIAFLRELTFRGVLLRALSHLMGNKGFLPSIITAIIFTITYFPSILTSLDVVSIQALGQSLIIPFFIGLYLSLLYYYGKSLWMCTIVHGVLISLQCLDQNFVVCTLEVFYIVILGIYLGLKIIKYYKGEDELEKEDNHLQIDSLENVDQDNMQEAFEIDKELSAEDMPQKMLNALDELHEELKNKVQEEKVTPNLFDVLSTDLEEEEY